MEKLRFLIILLILSLMACYMYIKLHGLPTQAKYVNPHHYQIEMVTDDSLMLWDANRLVGKIPTNWQHGLDSLILKDNE